VSYKLGVCALRCVMSSFCIRAMCWRVALRDVAHVSMLAHGCAWIGDPWLVCRADGGLKPRVRSVGRSVDRSVYSGTVTSVMTPLMPWCRGLPLVPSLTVCS